MEKELYRLSSNEGLPAVCRSVWDLALSDISKPDQCSFVQNVTNCDDGLSRAPGLCSECDVNEVLSFTSSSPGWILSPTERHSLFIR